MAIVLETTVGDITVDLYTEERPRACKNFLKLCKMKYYNFCLFHSVQSNFIAQTGDPTGTGNGGESVFIFTEGADGKYFTGEKLPKMKHSKPGLVSMVNCGDYLVGSQFFITLGSDLYSLDEHIIFGEVTEGFDVLLKLNETVCDNNHRPYQDIRITHTVILEDPYEDIEGLIIPPFSPQPTEDILRTDRLAADEEIFDTAKCSMAEIEEIKADQEAKAQATILEIVGDIPDKDIAPPENVLFVCKLNPVTTDEDLEIIFSRFGKINSCEIIRDKDSGDSLQYAFIEFDEKKSCEDAYLKMDNVLIDDRRIHVDFSQSVSKIRWRGKGRGVEYVNDKKSHKPEENVREKNRYRRDRSRSAENSIRSSDGRRNYDSHKKTRSRSRSNRRDSHRYTDRHRNYSHKKRKQSRSRSRSRTNKHKYRSSSKDKYVKRGRSRSPTSPRKNYSESYSTHKKHRR